jgi:hypothetical protein
MRPEFLQVVRHHLTDDRVRVCDRCFQPCGIEHDRGSRRIEPHRATQNGGIWRGIRRRRMGKAGFDRAPLRSAGQMHKTGQAGHGQIVHLRGARDRRIEQGIAEARRARVAVDCGDPATVALREVLADGVQRRLHAARAKDHLLQGTRHRRMLACPDQHAEMRDPGEIGTMSQDAAHLAEGDRGCQAPQHLGCQAQRQQHRVGITPSSARRRGIAARTPTQTMPSGGSRSALASVAGCPGSVMASRAALAG